MHDRWRRTAWTSRELPMSKLCRFHGILLPIHHLYNPLIVDNITSLTHLIGRCVADIGWFVLGCFAYIFRLSGGYLAHGDFLEGLSRSFGCGLNFLFVWPCEVYLSHISPLT